MKRLFLLIYIILITFVLSSCMVYRAIDMNYYMMEKKYYSDKDNFHTFTGELVAFHSDEKNKYFILHIEVSESDFPIYNTSSFKIERDNYNILVDRNFSDTVKIGDTVTFISAPEIFGDGYCPPIVAISVDDKWILDFDTGYENLMEKYKLYIFY